MGRPREDGALPGAQRGRLARVIGCRPLTSYFLMAFERYRRETAVDGPWPQVVSRAR